jgi:hypothetical protein
MIDQLVPGHEYRHECGHGPLMFSDRDGWAKHGWHDDEGRSLGDVDDTVCPVCDEPVTAATVEDYRPVARCLTAGCDRRFQSRTDARIHRWLGDEPHHGPWSIPSTWTGDGLTLDTVLPRIEFTGDVVIEQPSDRERRLHRESRI